MATTRLIVLHSFSNLHSKSCNKFQTSLFNPTCYSQIPRKNNGSSVLANGRQRSRNISNLKMDFVVYSSVQPGNPVPSGPPPTSWKNWILGFLLTAILPFLRNKWGPLLKLTEEVENAVELADNVAETMEKVAEEVEKVADDIADDLPRDGKLKQAIVSIENAAKQTAKTAHLIDQVIDKVEEVDQKVESFIEPGTNKANDIVKEARDQK